MFKFATNKFTQGNQASTSTTTNSGALASSSSSTTDHHTHAVRHHIETNVAETNQSILTGMLGGVGAGNSAAASKRRQLQKDLFAYNKIADKGFPAKPSAMDYDRKLKLIGIGTKNGDIRIYGAPLTAQQQLACYQDIHPFPILRLLFIQGQHQLITLTERTYRNEVSNKGESHLYLVLWQIPNNLNMSGSGGGGVNSQNEYPVSNLVEKIKEYALDAKIISGTRLSALTLLNDNSHLFLGFESGDIYVFNVASFQIVPGVINKDYILKNLPDPPAVSVSASDQNTNANTLSVHKKLTQLGAVESICHHPRQLTKLLLAYQRGLWVIFDFIKNQIDQINQTPQQLESAVFYQAGECVATSHLDGSFILWDLESSTTGSSTANSSPPNIVYGPFPCKPVTKCMVKTCRADQPYVIFSGGCPRVNYSDKITISVIQGENSHVCFDFTSKIIDFFTIDKPFVEKQAINPTQTPTSALSPQQTTTVTYDNPQALLVLLEEEFVAIDLVSEGWPQYRLPYLYSVHSSAVICTHYVNGVSSSFYDRLKQYGELAQDSSEFYSSKDWPVTAVSQSLNSSPIKATSANTPAKDLLLTGHEDGSVRFWDVTQMSMTLIYRLRTSDYFQTDSTPVDESNSNERNNNPNSMSSAVSADNWPPFRKVGTFDPYSDDPKLGIQKIFLCPQRHVLVVAGTAGQVLIMNICEQSKELSFNAIQAHKINIIGVSPEVESHFVWKGHEPLALRGRLGGNFNSSSSGSSSGRDNSTILTGSLKLTPGYQLHSLIQLYPPATVSALTLNTDWQLVGMGTSHGFALFDYLQYRDLLIRCTLDPAMLLAQNPNDSGNAGTTISRRKSLKKSLRESFRKLRRGRSQKPAAGQSQTQNKNNKTMILNSNTSQMRVEHIDDEMGEHHKPIERQVESREFKPMDDIPPSVIRYMYFVRTFITSSQQQTNSLWVGTNTGVIYIYALQFLNSSQQLVSNLHHQSLKNTTTPCQIRTNQAINCLLAKEMRLKHRAPVVHIQVIDQNMHPLPYDSTQSYSSNDSSPSHDLGQNQNHKVIICSEEQFKVFQLPTLKPVCKFKLTAVEGARVRRIGYNCYTSRSDPKYNEYCLSCLSNLGDLSVYNLPQLKRQVQIQCMKQQDINAITSFVFSKQGQAFYLQSPSEFVHISLSARDSPQQFLSLQPQNSQAQIPQISAQSKSNSLNNQQQQQQAKPKQSQQPPAPSNASNSSTKNSISKNTPTFETEQSSPQTSSQPPVPAPRTTLNNSNTQTTLNSEIISNGPLIPANRSTLKPSNLIESKPTTPIAPPPSMLTTTTSTIAPNTTIDDTISSSSSKTLINETILASSTLNQINASMLSEFNATTNQANNTTISLNINGKNIDLDKTDLVNGSSITNVSDLTSSIHSHLNNTNLTNVTPISTSNNKNSNNSNTQNNSSTQNQNNSISSSSSTNLNANTMNNTVLNANNNLINASSITSQSDVSFNVSSSGYNGSSILAGATSSNFGVDLSMDSVVDRFNDDFQDRSSSKRFPLAVDESLSQVMNQNDSLFNESEISDLSIGLGNKLSLNGHNNVQESIVNVNGHHQSNCNQTKNSGQINFTYENDNEPKNSSIITNMTSPKQQKTPIPSTPVSYQNGSSSGSSNGHQNRNGVRSPKSNGHQQNGHSHIVADEEINMSPQKASSPMVKQNGNASSNGHGMNGTPRSNKIEQVTKQIENGSKLEYRETAID